jgi:hypothetical protein
MFIVLNKASSRGPYYQLGTISTVPRAYEGMEGRKIKIKKWENVIHNKIQDFRNIYFSKIQFHYKPICEVGSVWEEHISQSVPS